MGAASVFDATARIFAEQLHTSLKRPAVVFSKLGAGGRLAATELKRAAPDGRILMVGASSLFTIYPNIYTRLEYDAAKDFTPIAGLTLFDLAVATSATANQASLQELFATLREAKGDFVFGAALGNGSSSHSGFRLRWRQAFRRRWCLTRIRVRPSATLLPGDCRC